jgi:gamma-glutamyl phosphate reductase
MRIGKKASGGLLAKTDKISACNALDKILIIQTLTTISQNDIYTLFLKITISILVDEQVKEVLRRATYSGNHLEKRVFGHEMLYWLR